MDDTLKDELLKHAGNQVFVDFINLKLIRPDEVHLESSSRCNADCIMCPRQGMSRWKGEMPRNLFLKVVEELTEAPPVMLHLHLNGEPMLLPIDELAWRITYAKKILPSRVIFFTNASLLTQDCTRKLLDSGLDEICFSVDGGTKETFEAIRRGLNFEQVVGNIRAFQELNVVQGRKIKTHAFIVPQKLNQSSLDEFHQLFWKIGIDDVGGSGVQNIGGLIDSNSMKLVGQYTKGSLKAPCWRLFQDIDVMADGHVPICCQCVTGSLIVGNANIQNIYTIWRSPILNEIRVKHIQGKQAEVPFCDKCDFMSGFVAPDWWPKNEEG
uniref:Putative radical SAM superfamily protein n=1 Tax=viral metagenome TaxID=1070528 RepID=A0A6M3KWL4_9ZZZZ